MIIITNKVWFCFILCVWAGARAFVRLRFYFVFLVDSHLHMSSSWFCCTRANHVKLVTQIVLQCYFIYLLNVVAETVTACTNKRKLHSLLITLICNASEREDAKKQQPLRNLFLIYGLSIYSDVIFIGTCSFRWISTVLKAYAFNQIYLSRKSNLNSALDCDIWYIRICLHRIKILDFK